jgi:hypothetical protein
MYGKSGDLRFHLHQDNGHKRVEVQMLDQKMLVLRGQWGHIMLIPGLEVPGERVGDEWLQTEFGAFVSIAWERTAWVRFGGSCARLSNSLCTYLTF